jgi:hypothetical protein
VENSILLATVAVKKVDETMKSQLRARMRGLGMTVGLLANFNGTELDVSLVRQGYSESKK